MNRGYQIVLEAIAGSFRDNLELRVEIFERDTGNRPHVHIRNIKPLGSKFHTCVRLLKNEYYLHEGKGNIFNSKERNLFEELMNQKWVDNQYLNGYGNITVWQAACFMWNKYNPLAIQIPRTTIMNLRNKPNYTTIIIDKPNKVTKRRT